MAEVKKKESGGGGGQGTTFWVLLLVAFLVIVLFRSLPETIVNTIGSMFSGEAIVDIPAVDRPVSVEDSLVLFTTPDGNPSPFITNVQRAWESIVPISTFFSLLFAAGIVYCLVRIRQIRAGEHMKFAAAAHPVFAQDVHSAQLRWNKILEQASTEGEQHWRLAIIEADIMLDELLEVQGYHGESMGDKMKQVERSDWNTIDLAWEAHKVRNKIAHEGSDMHLSEREARRVIGLYEQVFKEFRYIA